MTELEETRENSELNYEEMITDLKDIAKKLDDPATSVAEAVKLHERGMELVACCEAFLEKAEYTLTEVVPKTE